VFTVPLGVIGTAAEEGDAKGRARDDHRFVNATLQAALPRVDPEMREADARQSSQKFEV
jgi:hypothetical protein